MPNVGLYFATVVSLICNTTTTRGLSIRCAVDENFYEKGIQVSDGELKAVGVKKHAFHGEWNYQILPNVRKR